MARHLEAGVEPTWLKVVGLGVTVDRRMLVSPSAVDSLVLLMNVACPGVACEISRIVVVVPSTACYPTAPSGSLRPSVTSSGFVRVLLSA